MASSDFEQFKQDYKKNHSDLNKEVTSEENKVTQDAGVTSADLQKLQAQMQKLLDDREADKKKIAKLSKENDAYKEHLDDKEAKENETAMNDVITGFQDNFKETLSFKVMGRDEPLKISVEMKPLNIEELASLQQNVTALTGGQSQFFSADYQLLFEAASVFKVALVKGPEWLKDPAKMTRIDIPTRIYEDYLNWLDSFRESQEH